MLSTEPQNESYLGHVDPSGSNCVHPSDSPGVFNQKYASTSAGAAVAAVGSMPIPAPRALHQFAQLLRIFPTPLRPVSITKYGVNAGAAARMERYSTLI
mmetsp:Transcript_30435/g.41668  ORF Transcript_30435/g.41668 Transcript_30435/m.41668 type:complete len:99 (-) Transcript_30435:434-730(-)